MGDLMLTAIDDDLLQRLAIIADVNRLSLEEQVKMMLDNAVTSERAARRTALADRIAAMTPPDVAQTDSVDLLRADRDR